MGILPATWLTEKEQAITRERKPSLAANNKPFEIFWEFSLRLGDKPRKNNGIGNET